LLRVDKEETRKFKATAEDASVPPAVHWVSPARSSGLALWQCALVRGLQQAECLGHALWHTLVRALQRAECLGHALLHTLVRAL
jgi:hypothetical protein